MVPRSSDKRGSTVFRTKQSFNELKTNLMSALLIAILLTCQWSIFGISFVRDCFIYKTNSFKLLGTT